MNISIERLRGKSLVVDSDPKFARRRLIAASIIVTGAFATIGVTHAEVDRPYAKDAERSSVTLPVSAEFLSQPLAEPQVVTETLPRAVVEQPNSAMQKGQSRILSEGSDGTIITVLTGFVGDISIVYSGEPQVVSVGTSEVPAVAATTPDQNKAIGKELAASWGWAGDEWSCLEQLWNHESGWRSNASNKSSGAYGIPQALPGSKMASVGAGWSTNAATQISWGLSYISGRYATPCGAWGHFNDKGWY